MIYGSKEVVAKMEFENVIVTRHPAAQEFIRKFSGLSEDTPVLASASAEDVRGKIVWGNVPLHLAAEALAVVTIEFDGEAPRGAEYSLDEMIAHGAKLVCYTVKREDV
jgi:hypothetical protein